MEYLVGVLVIICGKAIYGEVLVFSDYHVVEMAEGA